MNKRKKVTDRKPELVTLIDPPSGWKYGFPKALPDPRPTDMEQWFRDEGYPQSEIDLGMLNYVRCWQELN
jgi:hypothetical protein